ncbi:MAG TPA: T9SS type A sorting domain-containing protein, partial [Saprospiraceae bacterium]|nr:T9SS type A sorting domain-containing protein [Saprospiraceae bacterium]
LKLLGQTSFNVVPETLGQTNQSRLFDAYPDSNFIYVIGDLLDTTVDPLNPEVRSWWGALDYNGNLVKQKLLVNDKIKGYLNLPGNKLIKAANGDLIYNTILFNENNIANSIILEIDKHNGNITKFHIYQNPLDSSQYVLPGWITLDNYNSNNIILGQTIMAGANPGGYIITIDSNFNMINSVIIDDNGRDNYIYYLEEEPDSTFILIGESKKRNDNVANPDIKPYFMRVNSLGKLIEFKLATGIPDKTVFFSTSDSYNITKDSKGNWVFGAISYFPTNHSIPYVYSYSPQFDSLNWSRNFSEDITDSNEDNTIYSAVFDSVSHSLVVCGSNFNKIPKSSYVFKIRENGDSVWTRHFIPLNWNPDSVAWALLRDIEITKYGTYISVGHASDFIQGMWRSWAINLDSFGCLVPGCQNTVGTTKFNNEISKPFIFYPNPTSSFLALLCNSNQWTALILSIYTENGILINKLEFNPILGYQYILDTSNINKGVYFINITDKSGKVIQVDKIIFD